MQVSPTEMQEVVAGLSGKVDKLYAEGLHVAGERYVLTKAEDRSLYARKVRSPAPLHLQILVSRQRKPANTHQAECTCSFKEFQLTLAT